MFQVGQKVARIPGTHNSRVGEGPAVGEVCTVVNVFTVLGGWRTQIELAEHPAPENYIFFAGFNAACFRPVVERKTDISVFTAMLNPSRKSVPVA